MNTIDIPVGTKMLFIGRLRHVEVELLNDLWAHQEYVSVHFPSGQVRSVLRWRLKPLKRASMRVRVYVSFFRSPDQTWGEIDIPEDVTGDDAIYAYLRNLILNDSAYGKDEVTTLRYEVVIEPAAPACKNIHPCHFGSQSCWLASARWSVNQRYTRKTPNHNVVIGRCCVYQSMKP